MTMPPEFQYDVFLSHSAQDKAVVRPLAERLRADGLKVWFDEWLLKPGDSIPAKIEAGLEHSRVLVLCMSAHAFGSDWAQLEAGTFRFRDPLNRERRFIPLRLDDAPIKGSLAQFLYINWCPAEREREYAKLLKACRPLPKLTEEEEETASEQIAEKAIQLDCRASFDTYAFSLDAKLALSGAYDGTVRLWEVETGRCLRVLDGHQGRVMCVVWNTAEGRALSGGEDKTVRLWDVKRGRCLCVLKGHTDGVNCVAWSADCRSALSGAGDKTVRLWDVETCRCIRVLKGHTREVLSVAWSEDGRRALSGSWDNTVRLWDVATGHCLRVLEGQTGAIYAVAWSPDQRSALSASMHRTVRLWDIDTGTCRRVLEGHTDQVRSVAWSADQRHALSGGDDKTLRLWDLRTGLCLQKLLGHEKPVVSVAWSADHCHAYSGDCGGGVRVWDLSDFVETRARLEELGRRLAETDNGTRTRLKELGRRLAETDYGMITRLKELGRRLVEVDNEIEIDFEDYVVRMRHVEGRAPNQVKYTNAKVLLIGESGVGKTGLSNYLAHGIKVEDDKPLPSTDGAWATHWPLKHVKKKAGVEREIWLWDLAGQVDYRLVHQLYMDDTAVAVLVFNPQNENPFEGLGHWDRDLQKAARKPFAKLLAAARIDRGGLVVSAASMKKFMKERGFLGPLQETSAKTGEGCDQLREAIVQAIDWKKIPETTSPALYHRLKHEILNLRDSGLVLIRLAELKQRMEMTLRDTNFELAELEAVVSLLAGPGMIQPLDFGGFILLRPEVLSRYAAAVVRKVRMHPQELGCIREDEFLAGDLDYQDFKRLPHEDEAVVLRTLLETFISRAWCLRQPCDGSAILTFPSYFRRERKEQPGHPSVLVTYRFDGPADDIYATLVVRLHHTVAFESTDLWKSAADFKTQTGTKLGFTLTRETEGSSRLEVYLEPNVDENSRVLFLRYVHDHLMQHAQSVVRLRHYACDNGKCDSRGAQFSDQAMIDKALAPGGKGKVFCPDCGKSIQLRDTLEGKFESPAVKEQVRRMESESSFEIDNESRELQAVHHTGFIVAEAGQIYRGYTNSDHGIDGEIEFKDDKGRASGKRLYVQLKSGDSYLKKRQRDGAEVFQIKSPRWADYWQQQAYAVMLVIRTSDGEIRWMDISAYLKRESAGGKTVRQIVFEGERLDVMSVRRWRAEALRVEPTEFECPFCRARLAERSGEWVGSEHYGLREIFECGYQAIDGSVIRPCPSDPKFPRFQDYDLQFHQQSDESQPSWLCMGIPKTEMARRLSLGGGVGGTREEAEQQLRETYERYATKHLSCVSVNETTGDWHEVEPERDTKNDHQT